MDIPHIEEDQAARKSLLSDRKKSIAILVISAGLVGFALLGRHHAKVEAQSIAPVPAQQPVSQSTINDLRAQFAKELESEQAKIKPLLHPSTTPAQTQPYGASAAPYQNPYIMPEAQQSAPSSVSAPQDYGSPLALSFREKPKESPDPATQPQAPAPYPAPAAKPDVPVPFACGGHQQFEDDCIPEGTLIDTVMINRLEGEFAGPVKVQVSDPVYSVDGKRVLIPAGTVALGEAKRVGNQNQSRLAVMFHRLIMPDGYSISLDQLQALDQAGSAGLHDKVNHHWASTFGASIAVGLLGGLEESGTGSALTAGGWDMYRQGIAMSMGQEGQSLFERMLNRMPSITIREGTRCKIFIAQDIVIPESEGK